MSTLLEDKLATALLEMLKGSHRYDFFPTKRGQYIQWEAEKVLKEYLAAKNGEQKEPQPLSPTLVKAIVQSIA